nr:hypothetical protein [Bacteroidota bacterium]
MDSEFWAGLNLGLALSSNLDKWAITAEVGLLKHTEYFEEGTMWNFVP